MSTHWKKMTNPDFLGAYAIDPEQGDLILTIKSVCKETFTGSSGKKDEGIIIRWAENEKPMICNSTNAKAISKALKTPYIEDWGGHKIALYVQEVSAFGETVDAIRVRPVAPKEETIICSICGKPLKAAFNMSPKALAKYTADKYGAIMCAECAKGAADNAD